MHTKSDVKQTLSDELHIYNTHIPLQKLSSSGSSHEIKGDVLMNSQVFLEAPS